MAQRGSMQEFLAMAVDAAKNAGQIIRSGFYQTKNVEHKGQVRSLRMSGSCALNLCGVACGRLDLFYELGFGGPWDITAGAVIVNEAGGVVFDSFEYFSNTKHFTSF